MAFEFGSTGHEKLVATLLAQAKERMPSNHFECIEKIHGNDNDKVIWFLSNKWMHIRETDDESRSEIHQLQGELVIKTVGPLANHLTDEEWDQWTEIVNDELSKLRTFNSSFLGLLWSRKELTDEDANKLNIFAWYYVVYYVIGAAAYGNIRPRVINDKGSSAYIESNRCLTIMHLNLMDAAQRLEISNDKYDLAIKGFNLIENFTEDCSWENYFDKSIG